MHDTAQNVFLEPFSCDQTKSQVLLVSAGERLTFSGTLLKLDTTGEPDIKTAIIQEQIGNLIVFRAQLTPSADGILNRVAWFLGQWADADDLCIASTGATDICVFIRKNGLSFFLSLDFPYSRVEGSAVGYSPDALLKAGQTHEVHSLTIGCARLTGDRIGNYDRAEIEAMSEYISTRYPSRINRAMFLSTSITNRMTDVREGRIFYSMQDNPTLTLDVATLKKEIELCAQLGIEYYQVFEGFFEWEEDGSTERALQELILHAEKLGVRVGDYVNPEVLNCAHYNYHHRQDGQPEWRILDGNGNRKNYCFGCADYVSYLTTTLATSIRKNREQLICLDGLWIQPCHDTTHGHAAGDVYRQVSGLVSFMESLNQTSPDFLTWSNSGRWLDFMPKLVWYNPNVYLTDPHPRAYSSALSVLKYYGDCRREQMVSVHNQYFVPYQHFCNCEYYAFPHARVDDSQFFEYSFLQGLCVTPNICLGELRTFLERIPAGKLDYCLTFIRRWLQFIRQNEQTWQHVLQLGDSPGPGAREAYAHIDGDRGWICLVNQNHDSQTMMIHLDHHIGLSSGSQFFLTEEYPRTGPIAEQPLPFAAKGDLVALKVPPFSVRIIRIDPFVPVPACGSALLLGIDGIVQKQPDGSLVVDVVGECGQTYDAALIFDSAVGLDSLTVQAVPGVPMYTFPARLNSVQSAGHVARFQITLPRDAFRRPLTHWKTANGEAIDLDPAHSDFLGGYIHNLYKENQRASLRIQTGPAGTGCLPGLVGNPVATVIPSARRYDTYSCELDIPFIEWPAFARNYGFDEVIELVFKDHRAVQSVQAAIDGVACAVTRYIYPVSANMWTWFIELTGLLKSGTQAKLEITVDWGESAAEIHESKKAGGATILGQTG